MEPHRVLIGLLVILFLFMSLSSIYASTAQEIKAFTYSEESSDWRHDTWGRLKSIGEGIEDVADNGWDAIDDYLDARDAGFSIAEAISRTRTLNVCFDKSLQSCEGSSYFLKTRMWEVGCRGDEDYCCIDVRIDCRHVLSLAEATIDSDLTLSDEKKLCITAGCVPEKKCLDDAECLAIITCPDGPSAPPTAKCDETSGTCYCAGSCPDSYCDYSERVLANCAEDCGQVGEDSDKDSLPDEQETAIFGTDPDFADTDFDGLADSDEVRKGTDPNNPDTDNGGQCDGPNEVFLVCRFGPDLCPFDSNNVCSMGVEPGNSIYDSDTDKDGIVNGIDPCPVDPFNNCNQGNDPQVVDSALFEDWMRSFSLLDPDSDDDGDGISNKDEYKAGTNPLEFDSDHDGMPDWFEARYGVFDPLADPDLDGLTNYEEYLLGKDPLVADTDGDGTLDGDEAVLPEKGVGIEISLADITPHDADSSDGLYFFKNGDTIGRISVRVQYSDGMELISPIIFGELIVKSGSDSIPLDFEWAFDKTFAAEADYDILSRNNEGQYLDLMVFAADQFNNTGKFSTRLFLLNEDDSKFNIQATSPLGQYAYGQLAQFLVYPFGRASENLSAKVFVEGSGETFPLVGESGRLTGEYLVTDKDEGDLVFLILASAYYDGREYSSVERISIEVSPVLIVEYLPDEPARPEYWFKVLYPNGQEVSELELGANLSGMQAYLEMIEPGKYSLKLAQVPEQGIFGSVTDSLGNRGQIRIAVPAGSDGSEGFSQIVQSSPPWLVLIVIAVIAVFLLRKRLSAVRQKKAKSDGLFGRRDELLARIKDTKTRFYKKKLPEEEASRMITEYEQELSQVNREIDLQSKNGRFRGDKDSAVDKGV